MKSIKMFVFGLIVGGVLAFPLGINFGRDVPLLSNPFAKPTMQQRAKQKAEQLLEDTKKAIHEATKPAEQPKK